MIDPPQIRAGKLPDPEETGPTQRVVAFFHNSAQGNSVIQHLIALGVPGDRLGVTPPEKIDRGQGMVLSIACPDPSLIPQVESICRGQGALIHRQRP